MNDGPATLDDEPNSSSTTIDVTRSRDGTLTVVGDIDGANAETLDAALRWHETTDAGQRSDVPLTIDVGGVGFVDSAGLRALVAASLRASRRGTRVLLCNARRDLRRLLEITGLNEQFGVEQAGDRGAVNDTERRYGVDESPA